MAVDTWLLASSCKWSRRKRASIFFFHFHASPAPAPISTAFPLKLTFFALLAGWVEGPASFAEAPTILLALWAEVEGLVGRTGASGVGGTAAGDGLVLGGFWPTTFLLLMRKVKIADQNKSSYRWYEIKKGYLPYFRSSRLIVAECSGTVSKWPRRAGDGWREITLLPNPCMRPPAPRTPRGTVAAGLSTTFSSSAIFCLLGDEDVSSSSSVSSFVRG
jgi:hypothetical protein